jgi:lysophospholipase L1-like esterase
MKNNRWMPNMLLIFFAPVAAGLLSEVALRVAGVSYPSFYRSDEHTGTSLRPGIEAWEVNEGKAFARTNSEGLRDREHSKAKPANTVRIAVLGDSYTEARQVPMEDAFWAVLERDLKSCEGLAGLDVEVINFGVSGYGTAQELITLRRRVWQYSPDIVILAFLTGNDVHNNFRELAADPKRPYFIYKDGALTLDASFRDSAVYRASETTIARLGNWLTDYSRVLQLINQGKKQLMRIVLYPRPSSDLLGEVGLEESVYFEPTDSIWTEAWRVTEGLIVLMRDEVRQEGAHFLVVTLSNGIQVHPDASVRRRSVERMGITDLFYPDDRIKALGEREGFSVLNLARNFQTHAERHKLFLHGFEPNPGGGHWNKEGHRLAGKTIAAKLCQEIASKGR